MRKLIGKTLVILLVVGGGGWALAEPESFTQAASTVATWVVETAVKIVKGIITGLAKAIEGSEK